MAAPSTTSEDATQRLNISVAWGLTILYWTCRPLVLLLWYLAVTALFLAKILYWPVAVLLQPVFVFARVLYHIVAAPFRLLLRFQDLYIYLGIAAIVGILGGLVVFAAYRFLHKVLRLESRVPEEELPLRSAKQYREERHQQKIKAAIPVLSTRHLSPGALSPGYVSMSDGTRRGGRNRGLMAQTILEEDDSDF